MRINKTEIICESFGEPTDYLKCRNTCKSKSKYILA